MTTKTYTLEELKKMPLEEVNKLLARQGATFSGTGIVRDKHGNPKYDDVTKAGSYGEGR